MKADFLKKVVIFDLVALIVFTVVMTVIFIRFQVVPDTLIQMFFTVFGLELLATMVKKITDGFKSNTEPTDYSKYADILDNTDENGVG